MAKDPAGPASEMHTQVQMQHEPDFDEIKCELSTIVGICIGLAQDWACQRSIVDPLGDN